MDWCETLKIDDVERNKILLECMPCGIIMVDPNGAIVYVNPKALEILGSPSAEATKEINMLTYPPLIKAGVSEILITTLSGGACATHTVEYTTKWGKEVAVRFSASSITNDTNEICYILYSLEDVSSYEKARQEVIKVNKVLKTLIDSIHYMIWYKDLNGRYLHSNKIYSDFCGLDCDSMYGKNDVEIWGEEIANRVIRDDEDVILTKKPKILEEVICHKELGEIFFKTYKTPVIALDGTVYGTVGVAIDVTEEKQQDKILIRAIQKLTDSLKDNIYVK
jgi:PAS domain S-box-containing protein